MRKHAQHLERPACRHPLGVRSGSGTIRPVFFPAEIEGNKFAAALMCLRGSGLDLELQVRPPGARLAGFGLDRPSSPSPSTPGSLWPAGLQPPARDPTSSGPAALSAIALMLKSRATRSAWMLPPRMAAKSSTSRLPSLSGQDHTGGAKLLIQHVEIGAQCACHLPGEWYCVLRDHEVEIMATPCPATNPESRRRPGRSRRAA